MKLYIDIDYKCNKIELMYSYFRMTVVSKVFKDIANTKDIFYGTSYATNKIPVEILKVIFF